MTETLLKPITKALETYKMPENALMSDHFEYVSLLTIGKDSKDIPGGKYLESSINGDDGFGNTWKVNAFDLGDFSEKDPASQYAERDFDLFGTMQYSDNRRHISGNKPLTLDAECKLLMIVTLDSAAPDEGKADIFVDDKLVRTVDPKEIGWTHCNALIIFDNDEKARHNVKIAMHEGDEDKKFTILAFGIR